MLTDYSHKQIKEGYTKDTLKEKAEERGLSTSGTKDELAERIKEYDQQQNSNDTEEYMFPKADEGPTTVEAESREAAREKLFDDNNDS